MSHCIRFDWAMKRLLRDKANFVVLEGLLSTLLDEKVKIQRLLESEGNKEDEEDKFNRVDLLAENSVGELIIVEIQNNRELDYFHRMLYGTSKLITEYIKEGEKYGVIRKVYSINVVYFDLGQGSDYVYKGKTEFIGLHKHDVLKLSNSQRKQFLKESVGDLYPEYYVLRVDGFDDIARTPLDEWISFLKTSEIPEDATALGLPEAREILRRDKLSREELIQYNRHIEAMRYQQSVIETGRLEGIEEGRMKGREEGKREANLLLASSMKQDGIPHEVIAKYSGLTLDEIAELEII